MARLHVICYAILIVSILARFNYAADEVPSSEIKAYDDVKNESELFHLILEKRFREALHRVKQVPSEAKTMIEILGGPKKREVVLTGLPLHFAFSVDIPTNIPASTRQEGMEKDQIDLIMALLKINPLAVAQKDKHGRIPLYLALISPNPTTMDVILALIERYPKSARTRGDQGQTPLHMAVSYPMTTFENVYAVLQAYPEAVEVQDEFQSLPLHAACWGGNFPDAQQIIELLVMQNPKHLELTDDDGETPLTLMAKYGRTSEGALRFMLEQDPTAVYRYKDAFEGNSPLHHAVASSFEQHAPIYKPFVDMFPDLLQKMNSAAQLPLHLALQRCCAAPAMVFDLLKGNPDAASSMDGRGYLPLHHAANAGVANVSIVEALVEAWPESVKTETTETRKEGPLPLHFALAHGEHGGEGYETATAVVEFLLDKYPGAAHIRDPDSKKYPLHQAFISKRSHSVLKRLMVLTPEAIPEKIHINEGGEETTTTLVHIFATQAHTYMGPKDIREIVELFARYEPQMFREKDSAGRLPLHMVWMEMVTLEDSRQGLVDALLTKNPDAVHAIDNGNNSVLSYITKAKDLHSFQKVFPMNPFAAAIKSDKNFYPLHQLCKQGAKGALSESVDKMMTILLAQHPAAAGEVNDDGNLPLHSLCESAGSTRVETHTIQKLIHAYPEALNTTNKHGSIPLHIAGAAATESQDSSEHEYWTAFIELLLNEFPKAVEVREKRKFILATVLDKMESLSVHRRRSDDHVLKIVEVLYEKYPDAVKQRMTKNRTGLHKLLALLGDMGGMTPKGWSDFTIRVIRDFPELTQTKDSHDRTPLQIFTLYLGDTSIATREHQDMKTRDLLDSIEKIYVTLIEMYPDALDEKDEFGITPLGLVSSDRLRYAKGGRRFYNAAIINMMKKYLRRGKDYWTMKTMVHSAATCEELEATLRKINVDVAAKLRELDVEPATVQTFTCDTQMTKLCETCSAQQELLGSVTGNLAAYADKMEMDGRDANEISGEYYVDANGVYVNKE